MRFVTNDRFAGELARARALAVLRTDDADSAGPAMDAAIRGGFRVVEFTWNTPGAQDRIAEFSRREGIVAGAGTVLCVADAREAVRCGAAFLVSPVLDLDVWEESLRLGTALVPGCATPGELLAAHRLGATIQKVFPAPAGGPAWIRSVLGPLPFLRPVPTSGVDASNAAEYLGVGCAAVGFVGSLFAQEDLRAGDFHRVESRARKLLASIS